MSVEANNELGRRFLEAQDRLRGGPDGDLCASSYVARIGGNPPMSLADHQGFANAFYGGFADLRHAVEETIADNEKVVVRFTLGGTHSGEFMGIPPTGNVFEVGAIAILRITNGKIAELRGQFDQLGMMQQLGVLQ
ncbi:MAG: ester cyclase [Gemmatimonadota bacterium]